MKRTYEQLLINNKNEYHFYEISDVRNFEKIKKSWKKQDLHYPNPISDIVSLIEKIINFVYSGKNISNHFDIHFNINNDISNLEEHELVEKFNQMVDKFNKNEINWKEIKKFIESTNIDISDITINFYQSNHFLFRFKILDNDGLILIEKNFDASSKVNKEIENVQLLIINFFERMIRNAKA